MAATTTELHLGPRFRGPPGIANGGFACGSIAALAGDLPAGTSVLLGRMTARLAALPRAGERCRVLAADRAVWVTVPRPPSVPTTAAAP